LKILLDENLDWRLRRSLPGHEVQSVPLIGWAGVKNGELLRRAEAAGFQFLITMDAGISHQQNLANSKLAIFALRAPSNRLADTEPLMPLVVAALSWRQPGTVTVISK
jgi:predicted nuclease of predicted toxin-antitoxin system